MGATANDIQVIDLFAGAGGLGLGASAAGASVIASIENDRYCCETLRKNRTDIFHQVLEADIAALSTEELLARSGAQSSRPLIVIGGAPCQPFSKAAYWTDPGVDARYRAARRIGASAPKPTPISEPKSDHRRTLIEEFYRIVHESNASGFLFENVPSILHPRNISTFRSFVYAMDQAGFKTSVVKANAAMFGVPQARERVFVIGARCTQPRSPHPTHAHKPNAETHNRPNAMTAGEALSPFSGPNYYEEGEEVSGRWANELFEIPPGMNYKALTEWAGHPKPTFVAETRFWNFLLKLSPDRPSWTLAASPGPWTGPFHWENRRLRTAEMAALQTFPLNYAFSGSRRERVRQIGNAVPVQLGQAMVSAVLDAVTESQSIETSNELRIAV